MSKYEDLNKEENDSIEDMESQQKYVVKCVNFIKEYILSNDHFSYICSPRTMQKKISNLRSFIPVATYIYGESPNLIRDKQTGEVYSIRDCMKGVLSGDEEEDFKVMVHSLTHLALNLFEECSQYEPKVVEEPPFKLEKEIAERENIIKSTELYRKQEECMREFKKDMLSSQGFAQVCSLPTTQMKIDFFGRSMTLDLFNDLFSDNEQDEDRLSKQYPYMVKLSECNSEPDEFSLSTEEELSKPMGKYAVLEVAQIQGVLDVLDACLVWTKATGEAQMEPIEGEP